MARTLERAWAGHAAAGGVIAGIAFAAFEMIAGAVLMGVDNTFMPLRMIAGIVLGPQTLDPTFSLPSAVFVAVFVHLMLSVGFALIFVAVVQPTSTMRSTNTLLVSGSLYGLGLWLVNFYVIAPVMGWEWFPQETNPLIQFLAHTFFYGWMLGAYLSRHAVLRRAQADHDAVAHHKRM
jgi:uncharacterized membrane protein YagU involved in acid resistance